MRLRLTVLSVAVVGGLAVGTALSGAAPVQEGGIAVALVDGVAIFCPDGGLLNTIFGTDDPRFPGFETPEAARAAFVDWTRLPATGVGVAVDIREEYVEAMGPLAEFSLPDRVDAASDAVYFDLPSAKGNGLAARLVVERVEGRYFLGTAYICSSAITDPVAWEIFEKAAGDLEVGK